MLPDEILKQAEQVVELYRLKNRKLSLAESCTGGLVAAAITSIPGVSNIFERGFVTYANEAKMEMLGVPQDILREHGAVSEECAKAMAEGAKRVARADVGLSITGIAGPDGGTKEKPVGLVYIALATQKKTEAKHFLFEGDRTEIRRQSAVKALSWLYAAGKEF